jgi:hypothetical protein
MSLRGNLIFFPNPADAVTRGIFKASSFDSTHLGEGNPKEMSTMASVTDGIQPEHYQNHHSVRGSLPQGRIRDWFKKVWKKGREYAADHWKEMVPGIIDFGKHLLHAEAPIQT